MNTLKKIVASSVVATTVLSLVVAVAPVKAAVATAGDLIKMSGNSSVYYLGADSKRYVFPNETTYKSWYQDFSLVKVIPQSELESYGIGGNVTIRPGTKLVKITTNPKVYAVEPGGSLKAIADEATAKTLYGADWAKRVVDVPDAFFINYKDSGATLSAATYPAGSLVKFSASSADVYYINADGTASKIASESAFNASRFQFANVLDGSATTMPALGAEITGATATDLTSSSAGTVYTGGSSVTVALSGATAASGSIIAGQSLANLGSFNFSAAADGAVKVTTLKLKRTGISQDTTLTNVYLYEGNTRLTDAAAVSSGIITFTNASGLFTIEKGSTKTITVKSDIKTGTNGETIGVSINAASDIVTDGASVAGSFPAAGNLMSVATGTNLATVAMNATTNPVSGSVNPGDSDVVVWSNNVTVNNHDVNFKYMKLREIGSIASTDLKDFNLYVGGVKVAGPVQMSSDYYVSFDMNAAPVLVKAGSKLVEVRATIVGGSSKTYTFSLRYGVDMVTEDVEYGVAIAPTGTPATSGSTSAISISGGSMTVDKKSDSATGNVTKDATGVSLAKYTVTAFGEATKIETLKFGFVAGGTNAAGITSLRNGKVLANGVQIGSTANLAAAGTTYTVNYTVVPGTPATIEVVADIYDTASTTAVADGSTVVASMAALTGNAQAQSSLNLINVPTAPVAGNTLTVKVGSLSLAKTNTYGNQTVVVPQTAYKLGSFVLSGNSTEDVNINSINVDFSTAGTFTAADLTNVYLKYGDKTTTIKPTVSASGNVYSITYTLAKSGTLAVDVMVNVGSTITSGDSIQSTVTVTGTTANSGATVTTAAVAGQSIAAGAGSIAAAATNVPARGLTSAAKTVEAASYDFTTVNNSFNIDELTLTVASSTVVGNVVVKDGSTVVATKALSGNTVTIDGMTLNVAAGATKRLTIALELGSVGTGAGDTGSNIAVTLTGFKATGNGQAQYSTSTLSVAGNAIYVYKSIPTVTTVTLPTTVLTDGTQTIAKFKVAAESAAGAIAWKKFAINVSSSSPAGSAIAISSYNMYDSANNLVAAGSFSAGVVTFTPTTEQLISSEETYSVKATIAGSAQNSSVTTSIAQDGTYGLSTAAGSVSGTFVWSDKSASGHSESTSDWTNGFLVKNLPTDSQALSR